MHGQLMSKLERTTIVCIKKVELRQPLQQLRAKIWEDHAIRQSTQKMDLRVENKEYGRRRPNEIRGEKTV